MTWTAGPLEDLVEDFIDGRVQFAYVRVKDPNTTLPKDVLIGWVWRIHSILTVGID